MKDVIVRADETCDGESGVDLVRNAESDEPAAIGDSITLSTYWGRIKATVLEIADPAREGMTLLPGIDHLLSRLERSSDREPDYRRLAVKLRLRNLSDGPFDRNQAIIPVMREYVVASDGKRVSGVSVVPASQYGSIEVPEPGQPSSTGWVGFHMHPDAKPQAFILEGLGTESGLWRLDRVPPNLATREDFRSVLLEKLKRGFKVWNRWRSTRPQEEINLASADLTGMDLSEMDFRGANLVRAALGGANLDGAQFVGAHLNHAGFHECTQFTRCNFSGADLRGASFARAYISHACFRRALLNDAHFVDCRCHSTDFSAAVLESLSAVHSQFWNCKLEGVHFDGSDFTDAFLFESEYPRSSWKRVKLVGATLRHSNLKAATFLDSDLFSADLSGADLSDAMMLRCDLSEVGLVGANLQGSTLSELRVYGVSAWGIRGIPASQGSLITTPRDQADLVVDDLELAQFMYLISTNEKIRNAIDTITSKAVLILGRFTEERHSVLKAIRERLRSAGLIPILFNFEKPRSMDATGVVETVARMARFIIADLTEPSSVPHELATIVPYLRTTPVQPLRLAGSSGYSMYRNLEAYRWFLKVYEYADPQALITALPELTERAEGMARELRKESST